MCEELKNLLPRRPQKKINTYTYAPRLQIGPYKELNVHTSSLGSAGKLAGGEGPPGPAG
jgi:hypothetical protein